MEVGIGVREDTALEHLVGWELDARHDVRRTERRLLDLGEVVLGVAIEGDLADGDERELAVRPHLRHVERVELPLLGLLERHHLERLEISSY